MFGTELPEAWMYYSDRCYVSTRLLWFMGFPLDAPVQAHRTMELYLKTFLVAQGSSVGPKEVWGHDLEKLRTECVRIDQGFDNSEFSRRIRYFQRFFDLVRYPTDREDGLSDGTGIWFAWEANIRPLDEMVAFTRPRVPFSDWDSTFLSEVSREPDPESLRRKALHDSNQQIQEILCHETHAPVISFDPGFTFDLPGC